MKPSTITATLGSLLIAVGLFFIYSSGFYMGATPAVVIGAALLFLAFKGGRVATLVFGHVCILNGAFLITWGLLLLPHSQPVILHVFGRPLFWGIFSLMGGVCAIFHGFCHCVTRQVDKFEAGEPAKTGHCQQGH